MKLMVFDVGGTDIKYSVMDDALNCEAAGSTPTPTTTLEDFLDTIYAIYLPHREEVAAITMSLPGFIDTEKGVVNGGGALTYNWGQPVGPLLSEKCGCPVYLANDGKCAAMAELWQGALKGCRNASVFLMGTGVGGGLIINGKIVNGSHFTAGEFSFVQTWGGRWEDIGGMMSNRCSTLGLLARYREEAALPEDAPINGRAFFRLVLDGDEAADRALGIFCKDVAVQLYNLTMLLDLERIAIGGGISKQPVLVERIRKALDELYACGPAMVTGGGLPMPEVVPCRFSSEANQVGAFYNAQRKLRQNSEEQPDQ